jgi:hypothetical protein
MPQECAALHASGICYFPTVPNFIINFKKKGWGIMKSKKEFRKCFLGIALMLLLCLLPISADAASVQLNKTDLKLSIGKTYTLKIKGTKAKAKWSSTKKSVVTVSSKGVVKAKAPGKAKIKAKVNKKT